MAGKSRQRYSITAKEEENVLPAGAIFFSFFLLPRKIVISAAACRIMEKEQVSNKKYPVLWTPIPLSV